MFQEQIDAIVYVGVAAAKQALSADGCDAFYPASMFANSPLDMHKLVGVLLIMFV